MTFQIHIHTPGSHSKEFKSLISEYEKRISRFANIKWHITKGTDKSSENSHLSESLKDKSYVALDEHGKNISTPDIAKAFSNAMQSGNPEINLVIGGAYGLDENIIKGASEVWAFGHITLPHQIVRLVIAEQCYRAMAIINNHPYHHS